jgi:hypothetical protein
LRRTWLLVSLTPRERHDRYPPHPVNGENLCRCGRKILPAIALRRVLLAMQPSASEFSAPSLVRCLRTAGDVKEIFRRPDSFLFLSDAARRVENPTRWVGLSPDARHGSHVAWGEIEIMNHNLTGAAMIRIAVAFAAVSAVILTIGGAVGYLIPRF